MRDSFIVQLAVKLMIAQLGIGSLGAFFLAPIAAWILGVLLDRGIVKIDLTIDSIKEAMKEPEWRKFAKEAYEHSSSRVYTMEEKIAIRNEYLAALRKYATFG